MIKFSGLWFVQLSGNIPQEETAELRARVCVSVRVVGVEREMACSLRPLAAQSASDI